MSNFQYQSLDNGPFGGEVIVPISATTTGGYIAAVASDLATNVFTKNVHGLVNNDRVYFEYQPGGITANYVYYVINAAANTFQVSTTLGGATVDLTTSRVDTSAFKGTPLFSIVLPNSALVKLQWNITTKHVGGISRRGYFIGDTAFLSSVGSIYGPQTIISQTTQRVGNVDFSIGIGVDYATLAGIVYISSVSGLTMTWQGYIQYKMIIG